MHTAASKARSEKLCLSTNVVGDDYDASLLSEMGNLHISPLLLEVFRYEPTVAVVRFVLAAQETAFGHYISRYGLLNTSLVYEGEEPSLERLPIPAPFLV